MSLHRAPVSSSIFSASKNPILIFMIVVASGSFSYLPCLADEGVAPHTAPTAAPLSDPGPDSAKGSTSTPAPSTAPSQDQFVDFGIRAHYYDYAEKVTPPLKSTERAILPGLHGIYRHRYGRSERWAFEIRAELDFGTTTYDGSTQSGTPVVDETQNMFSLIEWDNFYRLHAGDVFQWDLHFGLGYRTWSRHLGGSSPFTEIYHYFMLPAGMGVQWKLGPLSLGLSWDVRPLVLGWIDIQIADGGTGSLGNAVGSQIQIPIALRLSRKWGILLRGFYEFAPIGKGDTFTITYFGIPYLQGYEPASDGHRAGAVLGLRRYL